MTVFCAIFLLNKDISHLWYELGHIHKKLLFYEEIITLCNFYVCPKIFKNSTIFAKFVSHFSDRET